MCAQIQDNIMNVVGFAIGRGCATTPRKLYSILWPPTIYVFQLNFLKWQTQFGMTILGILWCYLNGDKSPTGLMAIYARGVGNAHNRTICLDIMYHKHNAWHLDIPPSRVLATPKVAHMLGSSTHFQHIRSVLGPSKGTHPRAHDVGKNH